MGAPEDFLKACKKGDLKVVQDLVASGIDVNVVAANHQGPALAAVGHGREEVVKLLLENGLVVTDQMIQVAVTRKRPRIAEMLILSPNEKTLRKSWVLETRAMANERGMAEIARLISRELVQ